MDEKAKKHIYDFVTREVSKMREGIPKAPPIDPDEEYVVSGKDEKGDSAPIRCGVRPDVARSIDEILLTRNYPWHNRADFVRYAISHTLHDIARRNGTPVAKSILGGMVIVQRQLNKEIEKDWMSRSLAQAEETVLKRTGERTLAYALRFLERLIQTAMENMPDDEDREWYLSRLRSIAETAKSIR